MTDLLYRYEEHLALHLADPKRLKTRLNNQQQMILALDGLQPDVGHEVLWGNLITTFVDICDSYLLDENEKSAKDQHEESRVVGHISLHISKSG